MRPSPPFRGGSGPPHRGRYSGGPQQWRPFRHGSHGGSYRQPHSPYGPLPSFNSPPDVRHSGGNFTPPPRYGTPPNDFASPRRGTPPADFRPRGGSFVSPRQGTPTHDFHSGRGFASPRHSTPMGRGGPRFDPPTTPFRTPPSRLSHGAPHSANGSADTSASYATAPESASCSQGSVRKSGPRRNQEGSGGKRRRTEFTFPGSLLKPSMLEDPWAQAVPVKRPEDGLVLSAGQRHSFLTPKKAAAAELNEEASDLS